MKQRIGISIGAYAERDADAAAGIDAVVAGFRARVDCVRDPRTRYRWVLSGIRRLEGELTKLDDDSLASHGRDLRRQMLRSGTTRESTTKAFCWIRETARRVLAQTPFDAQLLAGAAMLDGGFVEMAAGQGKCLAIGLAAATVACTSRPVEVICAREDRAQQSFDTLRPLYEALGMSVGLVGRQQTLAERQAAYGCDITYVPGFQIVLDYLHDRVVLNGEQARARLALERLTLGAKSRSGSLLLRGLQFALIDDADQILIDDAQRPFSLTDQQRDNAAHVARREALRLAGGLTSGEHFEVAPEAPAIRWLPAGESTLASACEDLGGAWQRPEWRKHLVGHALAVLHVWERGVTHEVTDGRLTLTDKGHLLVGGNGFDLLPLVAEVEGLESAPSADPMRRMSFPRFIQKYHRVAGTAATLREVRGELAKSYATPVVRVPRRRGDAPRFSRRLAFAEADTKEVALIARVREIADSGDALLMGVRTESMAETWRRRLAEAGLEAHVVDAGAGAGGVQPETHTLQQAGESSRISLISTAALRSARILEPARLHILLSEPLATQRLERVLFGHAEGSQVDAPLESYVSLEDGLLQQQSNELLFGFLRRWTRKDGSLPEWAVRLWVRRIQHLQERQLYDQRKAILSSEKRQGATLAFSGGDH